MSETREPYGKATEVKVTLCAEGWRLYDAWHAAALAELENMDVEINAWAAFTAHKKDCPICSQRKAE